MSKTTPRIIGLTGLAGTGKDTVRQMLENDHDFAGIAFADPIRDMITTLLKSACVTAPTAWISSRAHKEQDIPGLGASYRELAQNLGDWGRAISPDFWVRAAAVRATGLLAQGQSIVVSDVRYPNEAAWVRQLGGEIWRIDRPSAAPVRAHESERQVSAVVADHTIINSASVDALWCAVDALLNASREGAAA